MHLLVLIRAKPYGDREDGKTKGKDTSESRDCTGPPGPSLSHYTLDVLGKICVPAHPLPPSGAPSETNIMGGQYHGWKA